MLTKNYQQQKRTIELYTHKGEHEVYYRSTDLPHNRNPSLFLYDTFFPRLSPNFYRGNAHYDLPPRLPASQHGAQAAIVSEEADFESINVTAEARAQSCY